MSTLLIDFDIGSYALKDMKLSCASLEEIISNLNLAEASMKIGGKSCKNYGKIINMIESSKNINKSELQKIRSLQSGFSSFLKYAQQKENECVKIIKDDSTTFRVNKGLEVSGWVKAVEIGGTILIVGGLIVSAVLTGGSSLLICASIGAAAGAGMGYYKNRDSKNPWGHALFGAIKGGATGAMMSQMGPQLLAAGSQLSTVGLSGAALKTAGLKYVAEIFTKTTLKETVIGVAGQGIYQTVDSGIEGFIDNGVEGFKTNVVNALKQFNDPMNLIKTIGLTAVLAPGLRRISAIDKTKVPKGLDDSINNQAELRQRILKNIEESRKARESSGYKEWATEGVGKADSIIDGLKIIDGKVNGKIPVDEFKKIRAESIQNVNSDTITLGKYKPTVNPDGTLDWTIPGNDSYTVMAGDTTYFSLGNDWDVIKSKYNITDKDMFDLFNVPALNDAIKAGKKIRFSHDPMAYGDCALKNEWQYLKDTFGYTRLKKIGDFWYAK